MWPNLSQPGRLAGGAAPRVAQGFEPTGNLLPGKASARLSGSFKEDYFGTENTIDFCPVAGFETNIPSFGRTSATPQVRSLRFLCES